MGVAILPQHKVAALLGARRPAGAAPVQGCACRLPRLISPHFSPHLAGPQGLHQYKLRLPFAETAQLPAALPAEVNKHEASAYLRWLSLEVGAPLRLPTEAPKRIRRVVRTHSY